MLRDLLPLCALAAAACLQAEPLPRALQPVGVTAGGPSFTLVVSGQGFTISTRVLWEGSPLATYFESATRLSADVPATRLAGAGPVAIAVTRAGQKASEALTLTVNPRLEWTTASALSTAPITRFYAQALSVAGGTPPVRFVLASGMVPPGLHLDGYNGAIVGYPIMPGQFELTVRATDTTGASAVQTLRLAVAAELRIVNGPELPVAIAGQSYLTQMLADGGTPPVAEWTIAGGALPRGLLLDEKAGRIAGVAAANSGATQFTVRARDAAGKTATRQFSIDVRAPLSIALPDQLADFAEGDEVEIKLPAPPGLWAISGGELPPGLLLEPQTGALLGTLTKAGLYRPTLHLRDSSGAEASATIQFTVAPRLALIAPTQADGVMGQALSLPLSAVGGGPPYTWSIVDGKLPGGLRFDAGRFVGAPGAAGEYALTVEVRDRAQRSARAELRLKVTPPPLPSLQLAPLAKLRPSQQAKLDVRLDRPYLLDLDVTVQLAFDGPDDPAILLSTGGREARLTIPAGQLVPAQVLQLQTGTSAGTVTVEARLSSQSAVQSAVIDAMPPEIRSIKLQKSGNGFEVIVSAFSPTRELDRAQFAFDDSVLLEVPIGDLVGAWYADDRSTPFGTSFTYRQNFTVRGGFSRLRGVAVTLTNRIGASIPVSAAF